MNYSAYIPMGDGVGSIPPVPPSPKDFGNPVIGKCTKCGLELKEAMWYVCNQTRCPSGLGPKGTL